MTWYYRSEMKGIQRWILDSNRLRDLAGGSALVEQMADEASRWIKSAGGTVVYSAAGGVLATFPGRDGLEAFASEWPMYVSYKAPGLQMVQAWVDASGRPDPLADLFQALAARRNLPLDPTMEAGPWVERAGRSGWPAVIEPENLEGPRKRRAVWDRPSVEKERAHATRREDGKVFGDLLSLGELEEEMDRWPEGPVGVVHADGSGVGKRITANGKDLGWLKKFSETLSKCAKTAAGAAIETLSPDEKSGKLLLRPIVLGGDDVTVVLPAGNVLPFVRTWLECFEVGTELHKNDLGGEPIHAGVGVALVNRGYPFHMAYDQAETACVKAKGDVMGQGGPQTSAVRFRRITTALADDLAELRTWKLEELDALENLTRAAGGLPRGTLRTWLTTVDAGKDSEREALWRRAREVASTDAWASFATALEEAGADPGTGMDRREGKSTPVRDALVFARLLSNDPSNTEEP